MPFTSAYYNKKMMKPKHIMIAVVFRLLAVPFAATAQVPAYLDRSADIEVRVEDALSRMTLEEKIAMVHAQSKFSSPGVPRLGITEVWMSDGPHGVRAETLWDEWKAAGWTNDACTAFPCLECLAATWNPSLAGEYGKALGEEARYRGKTVILGPGVNIVRTPLCGRNHEYMGEEPLLAGTLAAEYIRGVQSCGVAACVKHFALNNQEARRHRYNAVVADAALHELYLPAFRTAVRDGGVWAMMGAYNKYKDEYCCHNGLLVRDILKDGWGFDGVFVSDWGGTHDTLQAVRGGLDIEFGTHTDGLSSGERNAYDDYFLARPYLELIREGTVGTEELDDKVRRVLRLVFRTTMAPDRPWGSFGSGAHSDVARRVAEEGIVLLKNDGNILPLSPGRLRRILVVGWNAQLKTAWGGGSAELKARYEVTPLDALRSHPSLTDVNVEYEPGYIWNRPELADSLRHAAVSKAASADVVLFFGGLLKWDAQDGEGIDRKSYNLPYAQDRLISELAAANQRIVVTMVAASAVAMPWNDSVPAILYAWYGGSEAGNAVTSTLLGDNAPSGRLPFTIYRTLDDCGAHFLDAYNPDSDVADYSEGRLVGYRWLDAVGKKALYPFGYGLGYTEFRYGHVSISSAELSVHELEDGAAVDIDVEIVNAGARDGMETVQAYLSEPDAAPLRWLKACPEGRMSLNCRGAVPCKELKAFAKLRVPARGCSTARLRLDKSAFERYSPSTGGHSITPGRYILSIARSSEDIRYTYTIHIKQ